MTVTAAYARQWREEHREYINAVGRSYRRAKAAPLHTRVRALIDKMPPKRRVLFLQSMAYEARLELAAAKQDAAIGAEVL